MHITVGGELSAAMLELRLDESTRVFTSPCQMKANNGILIIDDVGREMRPWPEAVGFAHALDKPTILLAASGDNLELVADKLGMATKNTVGPLGVTTGVTSRVVSSVAPLAVAANRFRRTEWLLGTCSHGWGRAATLLVTALCASYMALALDPGKGTGQYGHDTWTSQDGLPGQAVYQILQTRDGYLAKSLAEAALLPDGVVLRPVRPGSIASGGRRTKILHAPPAHAGGVAGWAGCGADRTVAHGQGSSRGSQPGEE